MNTITITAKHDLFTIAEAQGPEVDIEVTFHPAQARAALDLLDQRYRYVREQAEVYLALTEKEGT